MSLLDLLTHAAAIGSGLIAGVFFAFSSFVMPALSARPPAESVAAMQAINVKVLNRSFLGTFMGTALLCVAVVVLTLVEGDAAGRWARLVGAGLYVVGTFGVTAACNVPRNDRLALLDPEDPDAASAWATYDREWTAWNTVRTVAATLATVALLCAP